MKEKQRFYILKKDTQNGKAGECWLDMIGYPNFRFASFKNICQAKKFFDIFGAKLSPLYDDEFCEVLESELVFKDEGYFWKKEDLPSGAKKIKALSNGSIVDCYYKKEKSAVCFYRPNPNAKNVYKPLSIEEHIKHQKENGIY